MRTSRSPSRGIRSILFNGILLVLIAGGAWQFLQWGGDGDQVSPDDSPASRPPELVRQDLFRSDASPLERNRAASAWAKLGVEAVPKLVDGLKADEPAVRRYTAEALMQIGPGARAAVPALRERLHDEDLDVRRSAVLALGIIDDHLEENVPALVGMLTSDDESLTGAVREALVQTGMACIPDVCQTLADGDPPTRRHCVFILIRIGDTDHHAIAALRDRLGDAETDIRREAFKALADWDALSLDEIQAGLRDEDYGIVGAALESLGRFDGIEAAVPELLRLLDEPDANRLPVWRYTALLLARAGPKASAAVPHIQRMIEGDDENRRAAAVHWLAWIARDDRDVVSVLRNLMLNSNRWVAENAGDALREYDPKIARAAVPELIEALRAGNANAARALGGIGPEAADAVPVLIEVLDKPDSPIARDAIAALKWIGPAARPAVPRLVELLDYPFADQHRAGRMMRTLAHLGSDAAPAVPKLVEMIETAREEAFLAPNGAAEFSSDFVVGEAISALGHMGTAARPAVPLLLEIAESRRPYVHRERAIVALERIAIVDESQYAAIASAARRFLAARSRNSTRERTDDEAIISPSIQRSPDAGLRFAAARLLGHLGEPTPETISALTLALKDPDLTVRAMAALALAHRGPSAQSAIPALREALQNPVHAISFESMPTALFHSPRADLSPMAASLFGIDNEYWPFVMYPTARRSVRFAVLKALESIARPTAPDAVNEGGVRAF